MSPGVAGFFLLRFRFFLRSSVILIGCSCPVSSRDSRARACAGGRSEVLLQRSACSVLQCVAEALRAAPVARAPQPGRRRTGVRCRRARSLRGSIACEAGDPSDPHPPLQLRHAQPWAPHRHRATLEQALGAAAIARHCSLLPTAAVHGTAPAICLRLASLPATRHRTSLSRVPGCRPGRARASFAGTGAAGPPLAALATAGGSSFGRHRQPAAGRGSVRWAGWWQACPPCYGHPR